MAIAFLIFNIIIFLKYTKLLLGWGITRAAERVAFAYLLTTIQILGTLLFLGAIGLLRAPWAVALNGIIIVALHYLSPPTPSSASLGEGWEEIIRPFSNKIMISATIATLGWLVLCAYFLPPRGVDDITYHLPFVYESIQQGRWVLLPTDLRIHFAYPMNAEVFFSWPVLFLGDTRWVDGVQIPIGVWTSGTIYLFARHFGLRRTRALFLSGTFLLAPIVVAHMGTNYIDLFSAGFLLSSLYLTVRFFLTMKIVYARLAFLSIGSMMGMKYHVLFVGLVLIFMLVWTLMRKGWWREIFIGLFIIAGLGLGWHIRNWWFFSDWLYPLKVSAASWGMGHQSAMGMFKSFLNKLETIFITSTNSGTVHGSFGQFSGIMAMLAWFYMGWVFLLRKRRWEKGEILLFGVVLFFLLILIPIGEQEFYYIGSRILLVVWPVFLLVLGRVVFVFNKKAWIQKLVIIFWCLALPQDVTIRVDSLLPHYYWLAKSKISEFETYRYSFHYVEEVGTCASALDAMTRFLVRPTIFLAAPPARFFSAPFYGRFLQTRIINFDPSFKGDPDFLVYLTALPEPLQYIGKYQQKLSEPAPIEYKKIFSYPDCLIFAHSRLLK